MDRIVGQLHWTPLSLEISWREIEEELQCSLPGDFKELCETFGRGVFSGYLEIASSSGGAHLGLLGQWRSLQRIVEVNPFAAADLERFGIYRPGSRGLLPWADTYAECQIYWLASSEPAEDWPIVVQDSEGDWSEFTMSASEFIFRTLTDDDFRFSVAKYGPPYFEAASPR
ncbi:SMI1/KNR4 family protein [Streptomyces sp. NPDC090127]|uniref:SMI1/KNR4 family protein n=1 Tax=Streptomyces sp. NPDC090127 TaxID=3365953 RepID=UPI0037F3E05D